ncbi:MAG: ferrous iron transport protein A [Bdellovibrionia bacterium]
MAKAVQKVQINTSYEIAGFKGDLTLADRLKDLGFLKGNIFKVVSRAPFAGPIIVELDSISFALRESEMDCLEVIECQN